MVHGTEELMINVRTLLGMNHFWSWVLSCIVTKLEQMCIKEQVWNLFLSHLPFSIGNAITNQRLGVFLVIFQILR